MASSKLIIDKIATNNFCVGILGLGYVGLPLAVAFARNGLKVIGFEKSEKKIASVNAGQNYIPDIKDEELRQVVSDKQLSATSDVARIKDCDAVIICVPTPLDRFKKPDMSFIQGACQDIGKYMKAGTFVSLESTTYPSTTDSFMKPILESESGLKEGVDFWLCFSPERIDPGNLNYKTENTPKIVGAMGEDATRIAVALYGKAIQQVYPVSSPRVAEMVKILENTYRLVNISLVNELALLSGKMDIDFWEVIEAAKTKPYGFQAFYPGPGIGGHCIPLDPFYLEYVAKQYNFDLTMIETAGHIDNLMPHRMTVKISSALNRQCKSMRGSKILFLGLAYKKDIGDERESPALKIIDEVQKKGAEILVHDPYIPMCRTEHGLELKSVALTDSLLASMDCVVFTTDHSVFEIEPIVEKSKLVVDLRNVVKFKSSKVFKL